MIEWHLILGHSGQKKTRRWVSEFCWVCRVCSRTFWQRLATVSFAFFFTAVYLALLFFTAVYLVLVFCFGPSRDICMYL